MPEFDRLSEGYSAGFDDPVKRILGESANSFLTPKINLLIQEIRRAEPELLSRPAKLLDFGCGAGDFLGAIAEQRPLWRLEGCDISGGMLTEARKRLGARTDKIRLWALAGDRLPVAAYDVITVVCVLHHILPEMWSSTLSNLTDSLRSGGVLAIFEHNPWNPVTCWMVSRTEVDRHANLLSAATLRKKLLSQAFRSIALKYFLFFPPRFSSLAFCEPWLAEVPLGGQYAVFCWKR